MSLASCVGGAQGEWKWTVVVVRTAIDDRKIQAHSGPEQELSPDSIADWTPTHIPLLAKFIATTLPCRVEREVDGGDLRIGRTEITFLKRFSSRVGEWAGLCGAWDITWLRRGVMPHVTYIWPIWTKLPHSPILLLLQFFFFYFLSSSDAYYQYFFFTCPFTD